MEDDGTSMDGRDEIKEGEYGQVSLIRLGMGRGASQRILSHSILSVTGNDIQFVNGHSVGIV